MLTKTNICST